MTTERTSDTATRLVLLNTLEDCQAFRAQQGTRSIVLVPTMGALHAGHQALIRQAQQEGDVVMVSIFVNPTQFGPHEDFDAYPRTLETDLSFCEELGVDAVFAPTEETMYPNGYGDAEGHPLYTRTMPPPLLEKQLCGLTRPHFFTGVCSVVLRLFLITQANVAIFGEKDAQQLAIIRRMVSDLALPIRIVAHPIVREANGVAMSSRNRYFTSAIQHEAARVLFQTLTAVQALLMARYQETKQHEFDSVDDTPSVLFGDIDMLDVYHEQLKALSDDAAELVTLDYLSMVNDETFEPLTEYTIGTPVRVLMAAYVDGVRLIDNLPLVLNDATLSSALPR